MPADLQSSRVQDEADAILERLNKTEKALRGVDARLDKIDDKWPTWRTSKHIAREGHIHNIDNMLGGSSSLIGLPFITYGLSGLLTGEYSISEADESTFPTPGQINFKIDGSDPYFRVSGAVGAALMSYHPYASQEFLKIQTTAALRTVIRGMRDTDTQPQVNLALNRLEFGPGGASVVDTTLTRVAANVLELTATKLRIAATPNNIIQDTSGQTIITVSSATALTTMGGSISPAAAASAQVALISGTIVEAGSGVHSRLAGLEVTAPTITAGVATVTTAATAYISGAPSGTFTNTYALLVDAGISRINTQLGVNATPASSQRFIVTSFLEAASTETLITANFAGAGIVINRTTRQGFVFTNTYGIGANLTNFFGVNAQPSAQISDDGSGTVGVVTNYISGRFGILAEAAGGALSEVLTNASAIEAVAFGREKFEWFVKHEELTEKSRAWWAMM